MRLTHALLDIANFRRAIAGTPVLHDVSLRVQAGGDRWPPPPERRGQDQEDVGSPRPITSNAGGTDSVRDGVGTGGFDRRSDVSGGPRRLYAWLLGMAERRQAVPALASIAFAEASFLPVSPDLLLIPMMLARPGRAWWYATVATTASVAGAIAGYGIGYLLYDTIGRALVELYGLQRIMTDFQWGFDRWGAWIILIKGLTPIPFKLVTIASGVARFNFIKFVLACVAARGGRFFLSAFLLRRFGSQMRHVIERHLERILLGSLALLGGALTIFFLATGQRM